jgi:hypothetical protein
MLCIVAIALLAFAGAMLTHVMESGKFEEAQGPKTGIDGKDQMYKRILSVGYFLYTMQFCHKKTPIALYFRSTIYMVIHIKVLSLNPAPQNTHLNSLKSH